jgi:hypothetical protein
VKTLNQNIQTYGERIFTAMLRSLQVFPVEDLPTIHPSASAAVIQLF